MSGKEELEKMIEELKKLIENGDKENFIKLFDEAFKKAKESRDPRTIASVWTLVLEFKNKNGSGSHHWGSTHHHHHH
uniref:De Novo Minibinder fzd48 n=1 Tax=synthetic construct TaxID=32630 RepID=UPI003D18FCBB